MLKEFKTTTTERFDSQQEELRQYSDNKTEEARHKSDDFHVQVYDELRAFTSEKYIEAKGYGAIVTNFSILRRGNPYPSPLIQFTMTN